MLFLFGERRRSNRVGLHLRSIADARVIYSQQAGKLFSERYLMMMQHGLAGHDARCFMIVYRIMQCR